MCNFLKAIPCVSEWHVGQVQGRPLRSTIFNFNNLVTELMRSCLSIAALWSPAGKGLTSWPLLSVMFSCVLSLSCVVSLVRRGT